MRVLYASLADLMPFFKSDLAELYALVSLVLYAAFLARSNDFTFGVIQGLTFGQTRICFQDVTISTQKIM